MLTREKLLAIMPLVPAKKRDEVVAFLQAAMTEFAVNKPARAAAFLAQLAHESGQLRFMEEIWGPTEAQRRYEPPGALAEKLGNTEPGDGKRFKGRGPIQITGRANYRRYGGLLGIDLVSDPGRAALSDLGFRIAGLFWERNGLNELADRADVDAFRLITKRINGGLNGQKDREQFYAVACAVLGVIAPSRSGRARARQQIPDADWKPLLERGHEAIRAHFLQTQRGPHAGACRDDGPQGRHRAREGRAGEHLARPRVWLPRSGNRPTSHATPWRFGTASTAELRTFS